MIGISNYSNFVATGSPGWKLGHTANWRGGAFDGWRHVKSAFALDFRHGQAMCDAENIFAEACIDISRASPRILEDDRGLFQTFGVNELVRLEGAGAFIGGEFVNKIRNPRGEGGVVGAVGVTNKCTGYNAAPPALVTPTDKTSFNAAVSYMIAAGSTVGLFGIVDKMDALEAVAASDPFIKAGLDHGWLNGRVFKVVGSGSADSILYVKGAVGNLNKHSASLYGWVEDASHPGDMALPSGSSVPINSTVPMRFKTENNTPDATDRTLIARAPTGCTLYVILFDLVEATACSPVPTIVAGSAATGALPTNWDRRGNGTAGFSWCYLGSGIRGGEPYSRVRIAGTVTTGGAPEVSFESLTYAAASPGQAWGAGAPVELVSGSLGPVTFKARVLESVSGGSVVGAYGNAVTGSGRQYTVAKEVIPAGSLNYASASLSMYGLTTGEVDFTYDIYAPKLVQVYDNGGTAGYMPTHPILSAVGNLTESSCDADVVLAATPDWLADMNPAAGMSELVIVNLTHVGDGVARSLFEISDGSELNSVRAYINPDDQPALEIISDGALQIITTLPFPVVTGLLLLAFGWSADGGYIADQSGNVVTFDAITLPLGLGCQQLGGDSGSNFLNDILVQAQTCSLLSLDEVRAWMEHERA